MNHELEYKKASQDHIDTWEGLKKTVKYSTVAIVILLAALAFFFAQ